MSSCSSCSVSDGGGLCIKMAVIPKQLWWCTEAQLQHRVRPHCGQTEHFHGLTKLPLSSLCLGSHKAVIQLAHLYLSAGVQPPQAYTPTKLLVEVGVGGRCKKLQHTLIKLLDLPGLCSVCPAHYEVGFSSSFH